MSENAIVSLENLPISESTIRAVASRIDFNDPNLTLSYGSKTMTDIANFADSLLGEVRVKDSGPVGQSLAELMQQVKGVDISKMTSKEKGFLESLPIIGRFFDKVQKTRVQFDTVLNQVEGISKKLEESQFTLLKDIQVLDQLYDHNKKFYEELSAYIQAGEQRLAAARETELPVLEARAKEAPDSLEAQNLRDYADKLNRFERRLHDLKLSRTITMQTAPQIRMIQNNNQTLAEKIQTSILATIPIWKNQMVLALSINSQRNAAQLQKQVSDTTNDLLVKNAEMLQQSTVATAREVERSIVDIESLKTVHQKLLSTIEETMAIASEGREKRRAAEQELITMEENLKQSLIDLANKKAQDVVEGAKTYGTLPEKSGHVA